MSDKPVDLYKLSGRNHDLVISFPLERGIAISIGLVNKKGEQIDRWEKEIPGNMLRNYRIFIPSAKHFLGQLLSKK